MVEASIVLPLLILTILSMILITVYLYERGDSIRKTHVDLAKRVMNDKKVFSIERSSAFYSKEIRGLYKGELSSSDDSRLYVISQAEAVRIGSLG